jgi:ArsR family transcriptional regulator
MSKYRSNDQDLAEAFHALSNPNRLAILKRLMSCCTPGTVCSADTVEQLCVGELGDGLSLAPSTLSHHIRELSRAGLIETQRQGKQVHCRVNRDRFEQLAGFFTVTDIPETPEQRYGPEKRR